jgi:hypothetical protein
MVMKLKPDIVFHADWGSRDSKRCFAMATLAQDGCYTASGPSAVGDPIRLLQRLRKEAGQNSCMFLGFDFPIGIPEHYAKRAGVSKFREFLLKLGHDEWSEFYSVCDKPEHISVHRPFYPNGSYKGRKKKHLFEAHGVESIEPLLRRCELGVNSQRQACCLFWTLGGNQVGKAAIAGWRDVLAPALREQPLVRLWPFDGTLDTLLVPGNTVVAETYPAECCGWFPGERLRNKSDIACRAAFAQRLLLWASANNIAIEHALESAMCDGFPVGADDAFDAVVGLFGMLRACLAQRASGEPDDAIVRDVEGWILGRNAVENLST